MTERPLGVRTRIVATVGLLLLIYWVVPNRPQHWRDVWPGALLCGVLIEILTLAWPIYTRLMHGFNTYGQTFGLFFLLLVVAGNETTRSALSGGALAFAEHPTEWTRLRENASLIGTAIRDAEGSRTAEVAAGVRDLVGAHPAYPEPVRTT